jgi:N-acetylneuraminic acid mutarotase
MRGRHLTVLLAWILVGCTPATITVPVPATQTPTVLAQLIVASATLEGSSAGAWSQKASMLTNRSEMPAVELNGLIYVPGGFGPVPGGLANGKGPVADMDAYDPAKDEWKSLAPMPEPRHHEMITVYQDRIYVFGGFLDPWITKDNAWVYDPAQDGWQVLNPMPAPRTAGAAVTLGDAIYLVGGTTSQAGAVPPTWKYDPETDTWKEVAPLQEPREHNMAVVLNGMIYALGGRWKTDLNSVEVYDPSTDEWTFAAAMHDVRAGFGAAVMNGRVYVAGGERINELKTLKTVEVFDPDTNTWSYLESMPAALHGVPLVSVDGTLYAIGGSGRSADVINAGRVFAFRP